MIHTSYFIILQEKLHDFKGLLQESFITTLWILKCFEYRKDAFIGSYGLS